MDNGDVTSSSPSSAPLAPDDVDWTGKVLGEFRLLRRIQPRAGRLQFRREILLGRGPFTADPFEFGGQRRPVGVGIRQSLLKRVVLPSQRGGRPPERLGLFRQRFGLPAQRLELPAHCRELFP